jgi:hypothetical protein
MKPAPHHFEQPFRQADPAGRGDFLGIGLSEKGRELLFAGTSTKGARKPPHTGFPSTSLK